MCTLAVFRDVWTAWPLVVAANRDEFLVRSTESPRPWPEVPGLLAGRDLEAGGTWFGVRQSPAPLVVGVLNRRPVDGPSAATAPGQRSRGLLCLDALRSGSRHRALAGLSSWQAEDFAGFNLLLADREGAVVVDNRSGYHHTELEPGLSVLTNLDLNDPRCPRLAGATRVFAGVQKAVPVDAELDSLVAALGAALASHEVVGASDSANPLARVCVHTHGYGTRSSSIVAVPVSGPPRVFCADGAPCSSQFRELQLVA